MTKGEAAALDNNTVVFPLEFVRKNNKEVLSVETTEQTIIEGESDRLNLKIRFARLKKSLRKRSASIL